MIVIHDRVMIFSLKYILYILSVAGIIQLRQYLLIIEEPVNSSTCIDNSIIQMPIPLV